MSDEKLPTSIQMMKYAGNYVKLEIDKETNQDKRWFDWGGFKASIDGYKGDDLIFDKFKSTIIANRESTVSTMVEKIVKFLVEALSVVMDEGDIKALTSTIEATFTNLKEKSSNGFLDFNKPNDRNNSSWKYRIQFAFPNPDLPDYFFSLVSTIKLEANVSSESEWWGLSSSSSRNFSTAINAIKLVMAKDFKIPN
ncbi:delta-endotoxin CytB [Podospora fimiseda]|uniref:Delta-endotoxin CytB n=1 Tax=Podospora fimiseda TaxID=252190 RepID=A0AAN7BIX5_9PEZI|nr:delta-endotoxin CytB [Podospora fimiseda]